MKSMFNLAHLMSMHRVITNSVTLQNVMTLSEANLMEHCIALSSIQKYKKNFTI